jgi:hypothetical protein
MNRQGLITQLQKPTSQDWLDSVLDWLEHNPSGSEDRVIVDGLLSARGSLKRARRIKEFIFQKSCSLENLLLLVGIESKSAVQAVVDRWVTEDTDNIARLISQTKSVKRSKLVSTSAAQQLIIWLKSNSNHPLASEALMGLMYHYRTDAVADIARTWISSHGDLDRTVQVLRELLEFDASKESIRLAEWYVVQNIEHSNAQVLLSELICRNHLLSNRQRVVAKWHALPKEKQVGRVLASLLRATPQRKRLVALAKGWIEEERIEATEVMWAIIDLKLRSLSEWARDWLINHHASPVWVPQLLYMAQKWDDKDILDHIPVDLCLGQPWLLRMVVRATGNRTLIMALHRQIEECPDAANSFLGMRAIARHDNSALPWLKNWVEDTVVPGQIVDGIFSILERDSTCKWCIDHLSGWISNQVALGWSSSRAEAERPLELRKRFGKNLALSVRANSAHSQ